MWVLGTQTGFSLRAAVFLTAEPSLRGPRVLTPHPASRHCPSATLEKQLQSATSPFPSHWPHPGWLLHPLWTGLGMPRRTRLHLPVPFQNTEAAMAPGLLPKPISSGGPCASPKPGPCKMPPRAWAPGLHLHLPPRICAIPCFSSANLCSLLRS